MLKYTIRRLLAIIPILLGISFIVFAMMDIIPGDPGTLMLGDKATQAQKEMLNEQLGYNRPFAERYFRFLTKAVQGDLGTSYRTRQPVMDEIMVRFPKTLRLAVLSLVTSVIIGIPLGILSAVRQYSKLDVISTVTALLVAAIPTFWLGLLLMLLFSLQLGWLPASGSETWRHYIMPTITLALPLASSFLRLTRLTMLEVINQDYIRTARSKGVKEMLVIVIHAFKNASLPVVNYLGMAFGGLLGGTVIIESIFAMPGLGTLMINSIRTKDIPQVMGTALFLSALFCLVMLVVDVLYAVLDPRVRSQYTKA